MARGFGSGAERSRPLDLRAPAALALALIVLLGLTGVSEAKPSASTTPPLGPGAAGGEFGLDMMREQRGGNLVLSPDSAATALAMAGIGAVGSTAAEMAETLHLPGPAAFPTVGRLQRAIAANQAAAAEGHPEAPTLSIANGLFLQAGLELVPSFAAGLERHFGADAELVDFEHDIAGALATINSWVSARTNGLIPQLFDGLDPSAALVLVNTVYLDADWRHRFSPGKTASAPFHSDAGDVPAEFMHQATTLRYASGDGYQSVELPYRASTLALLVVMPREGTLGAFQRRLSSARLSAVEGALSPRTVELSLPRFSLSTHTDLDETLQALGMRTAFSEAANFSRMQKANNLSIGRVVHAVEFEVDEEGTVAAAATGVEMIERSARKPRDAVRFNANHPFLFFLRDTKTGAVLFAGRLVRPASAG